MAWQASKKGCLETRYEVTLNHEGEQVGKKPKRQMEMISKEEQSEIFKGNPNTG